MKKIGGMTRWQWQCWLWDKRMAYQRTYPIEWRIANMDYYKNNCTIRKPDDTDQET